MKGTPKVNRRATSAPGAAAGVILAMSVLLAGCSTSPSTSPSVSAPPATTSPTTTATPTPTPTPDSPEAKITAQIKAYNDFLGRAFTDPSVSVKDVARYLTDVEPDLIMSAASRSILQFRADGYKQTGTGSISVTSISHADASYRARVCADNTAVVVTNAKGEKIDTGPGRGAAEYTMVKGADGIWRASHIQGVGTC